MFYEDSSEINQIKKTVGRFNEWEILSINNRVCMILNHNSYESLEFHLIPETGMWHLTPKSIESIVRRGDFLIKIAKISKRSKRLHDLIQRCLEVYYDLEENRKRLENILILDAALKFGSNMLQEENADLSLIYVANSLAALYHDYQNQYELSKKRKILKKIKSILSDVVDLDEYIADTVGRETMVKSVI